MPINCDTSNDVVELNSTATLSAEDLWRHSTVCEGLVYNDGVIQFAEGATEATLQTGVFRVPDYLELVPSWNIIVNDSKVRLSFIPSDNSEQDPLLFAYWTGDYNMSFSPSDETYGRFAIDTFIPKTSVREFSFLLTFEEGSFSLKNLSITTKQEDRQIELDTSILKGGTIHVPPKQQLSIPTIGSSICSPTSLSMVLEHYNIPQLPAETAGDVFDIGAQIYGNWAFNASYAGGEEHLYSRVEYIDDLATIQDYLYQGVPLILSIKTTSKDQLTGSIMAYPSGHLIVLTGLVEKDGVWYGRVNDPAEYTDENVYREYPLEQLLHVMRGYAYVIQKEPF